MSRRDAVFGDLSGWSKFYDAPPPPEGHHPHVPSPDDPLYAFLRDLRLLRNVPLGYLVPDPRMLPPESVRFFHVDPLWTDRLVEGALSAASISTADELTEGGLGHQLAVIYQALTGVTDDASAAPQGIQLDDTLVAYLRDWLDGVVAQEMSPDLDLDEQGSDRLVLTGMLMRSEIVHRWPRLRVEAFSHISGGAKSRTAVATPWIVADGIMLALFAGVPARVEVIEPDEGTRFGVEPQSDGKLTVQYRAPDGTQPTGAAAITVPFRDAVHGVIDVAALASAIPVDPVTGAAAGSAQVALCLQQTPYAQVFVSKFEALLDRLAETRAWRDTLDQQPGGDP